MTVLEPQNRFTRRQKLGTASTRFGAMIFLSLVALIGWAYVIFASEALSIKDVQVRGLGRLDVVEVKREVFRAIDGQPIPWIAVRRHRWFLQERELKNTLKETLFAEEIVWEKRDGNILRLIIKERPNQLILQTSQQLLLVNTEGRVLKELGVGEVTKALHPPIIIMRTIQSTIKQGERVEGYDIRGWLDVALELDKLGVAYHEIRPPIDVSSTRLAVKAAPGYVVWFDSSSDTFKKQLEAYKAFEDQKPKDLPITEYVDARIPGRIYVK